VVDWIEAAFDRELAPWAVSATCRANGAASVSANAFAEPLALALDEAGAPTWIADENGELPAKAWAVAAADDRFAVAEADAVPLLDPEPAAAEAWFLSPTNRIDYLVIASRALAPAAQELADYRAEQGLRAGVATFEDVCDLLTGGVRTPEAIPELLGYAAATWARPPQMVVLAGNGHYDYLGANTGEANHLPPLLVQTPSGVCASDARLADAGGDALPDVALGRLPALTVADLTAMIAKIKAYEADFGAEWQNQLVFVSDKADSAGDFREANSRLAALATGDYSVPEHIELDEQDLAAARARLMNRFKAGTGFIHYTGHGGLHNFSAQNLLTEADVGAMTNALRTPVAVALSCLVGRYEVPTTSSLGEALMRRPQGGAVAVLGPSGLSRNAPATELGESFYRAILEEGTGRLGLAFLRARRSLPESQFPEDTVAVYNLLGDPALRIAGNRDGGAAAANFAQWRWERFAPAELAAPAAAPASPELFADYALGGAKPISAELPEFGFALPETGGNEGFVLRWKRRIRRNDVEYRLFLSHDLETWEENSPDLQEVAAEPDADGVMETVRTRVRRPSTERTYLGIKAKKK
jgi:hypothetical protein